MAIEDKTCWNQKYETMTAPSRVVEIVEQYHTLAAGKVACDIACGLGRHTKFLADRGYDVDALDISSVAIETLQGIEGVHTKEVDFDDYAFEKEKYDLVVCTYFLDRTLFPKIKEALKPGGIIIYETFVYDERNERAPSKRSFLLEPGELKAQFEKQYKIHYIKESMGVDGQGYKSMIASLVAQKRT